MTYVYLMLCRYCNVVRGIESSVDLNSLDEADFNPVYCTCHDALQAGRKGHPMKLLKERPPCSQKYACYVVGEIL